MDSFDALIAAYGLTPNQLSDERKRQLNDILGEAIRGASRAALERAKVVLQDEAQKRGIQTKVDQEAVKRAEEAARLRDEAEAAKAQRKRYLILGGVGVGVASLIGLLIWVTTRKP